MTFESAVPNNGRILCHYFGRDGERWGTTRLGRDSASGEVYNVGVAVKCRIIDPQAHEIFFFVEVCRPDGSEEEILDGSETRLIIPKPHRRTALNIISEMLATVVGQTQPQLLVMVTARADLPEKALIKFEVLRSRLTTLGYSGGQVDPYHGSRMWIFQKT